MTGRRATCPRCGSSEAVSASGALRRHPRGSPDPCVSSGALVLPDVRPATACLPAGPRVEAEPHVEPPEPEPAYLTEVAGEHLVYRSAEPMMEKGAAIPAGHALLVVSAVVPLVDGPSAARLYEDPALLYDALSSLPNDRVRVTLRARRR